jgi:uncharacterized repeat protein (TIGR01451 family)
MLSMLAAPVSAQPISGATATATDVVVQTPPDSPKLSLEPATATASPGNGRVIADKNATGPASYIVQFTDAALASYRGGINGLEATNADARGEARLDLKSGASEAYLAYLDAQHSTFLSAVSATLGRSVEAKFDYKYAFNGVAIELSPEEAAQVAALPGVRQVQREFYRYTETDYGPEWIGADGIWNGTTTGGLPGTQGEGVTVGIIDTGQNLGHPSFAEVGPSDGYTHTNPLGSGNFLGVCDTDPGTYVCNDKLIGFYIFTGETTEDGDGHGSHTGSTTAGNVLDPGTVDLTPYPYSPRISGVAPHANIIGYKACLDAGGCPGTALIASIDQTVADGVVDVINYSIGGGTSDPWNDADSLAFLGAADAGIVPVTSASNAGPGAGTIGSPADSPWMLAVGASTHNRAGLNALINMTGGDTTPPADIDGKSFSVGYGPAPIVYAGDYGDAICLNEFAPGTFSGEIVVCDRGTNARVAKGYNVLQGGAGGMILANASASQTLNGEVHHLPAVHITFDDGVVLKAWLASGSGHMATIAGTTLSIDDANGDIMAGFSSRGPNVNTAADIIKPDVTAPGVDILAAYRADPPDADNPTSMYAIISGTSMSSPHTAGAAALMKALHPDWSPAAIKSALMSTASTANVLKEDGSTPADPFDMGGGRVDLSMAGEAGFVLDETTLNFENADPALGGDPKTLNLASLGNSQCLENCSWTRVLSSTQAVTVTWTASVQATAGMTLTVTPSTFDLAPYATQVVTVTADVSGAPAGDWIFGEVSFTELAAPPLRTVAATSFFTSTAALTVTDDLYDGSLGSMVCDVIDASAIPGGDTVDGVQVGLGLNHTWVGDVVVKLQSPDSSILGLVSRPGYAEPADDGTGCCGDSSNLLSTSPISFLDTGTYDAELMGVGINICLDDGECDFFPNPGAVAGLSSFAGFTGESASGNWSLCIGDSASGDEGFFQDWSLTIDYSAGGPTALPAAHFPVAVVPTAGVLPTSIDIATRRDAGSQLVEGLESIEITDLTVDVVGLAQGLITTEMLDQDPTNGDPYDTITGTFYITTTVPAGAARLVGEIYDSTAVDLDLFIGSGTTPSAATQLCSSTTATFIEYCELVDPAAGDYWILVQNWQASGTPPDSVSLSSAVVAGDAGNMSVTGPSSVPAGTPYDIRVFWDDDMTAGDFWYGAISLGSSPGSPGDIGTLPVNLERIEDDVVKTVSDDNPLVGETLTYTITIAPNETGVDLTYALTDTIPAGLTYVPGSVTASEGTITVTGDTLTWNGVSAVPSLSYNVETSVTDPAGCIMPLANSGAYVDLQGYGILANPGIFGDTVAYSVDFSGGEFEFFGANQGENINFTDDGFAFFDSSTPGATPWVNQPIPTPGDPDNLMAFFWRDMEIVYDAGLNRGVSLANLTSGGVPSAGIIEYDDVEDYPAGSNDTYDVEMLARYYADPSWYEYIFAFDNLTGDVMTGTIGLENIDGSVGVQYAYDDIAVTDGMAVCFDQVPFGGAITLTYQVTVDTVGTFVNNVESINDNPGAKVESTDVTVTVDAARLRVAHLAPFAMDPGTAVTVTLNGTPVLTDFAYTDSTLYLDLIPDTYLVEIFPGGSPTPAITGTVALTGGVDYTAIAIGDGVNQPLSLLALVDDNTAPAAGNFKLRLGHLAPFADTLAGTMADIRLDDGTAVLTDVVFGAVSPYLELPAGTYDLKITTPGGGTTLINLAPVTFVDGQILSAFATGDGTNQPLGGYALPSDQLGFVLPLEGYNIYLPLAVKN